jgi:hypothetical protein
LVAVGRDDFSKEVVVMTHHRTGYLAGVAILGLLCACGGGDGSSTDASVAPTESSVTALTDEALVADLAALWNSPGDATEVAAFYAPEAVIHDNVSGETSTGLEAIQATIEEYAARNVTVENTSAPIRQDNVVAVFQEAVEGDAATPYLSATELNDGKVINQWMYPTSSESATTPPEAVDTAALMAAVNDIWGGTGDAADVAALYAPDATFLDTIAGETYAGVEAIQAKVEANASAGWVCEQTSDPIQQGNVVAVFHRFDFGNGSTFPVLAVFELKDGKVINQTAYPAP